MKYTLSTLAILLVPTVVSAQEYFPGVDEFFLDVLGFINDVLVPLLFSLALVVFIYGMFKYFILGGSNEEEQKKGKQLALWAIIGFVLMVSIWGIVNLIAGGLFSSNAPPTLPGSPGAPTEV